MDDVCDARIITGVEVLGLMVGERAWGTFCELYEW
jgi:hypothetical protein